MGKREAAVEDTRERVIAAARETFSGGSFHRATLDDVAHRAGVARATVYYQFASKLGLLDAVIAAALEPRMALLRRARSHPDAAVALAVYIRAVCRFWESEAELLRNAYGLAAIDPDAAAVIARYDDTRREMLVWLVKRLSDQQMLREGVTQRRAVDVIWLLTSFRSFDHLYTRSGLSMRAAAGVLRELAETMLAPRARASG
jgi:AcrR family transcriptional regulator